MRSSPLTLFSLQSCRVPKGGTDNRHPYRHRLTLPLCPRPGRDPLTLRLRKERTLLKLADTLHVQIVRQSVYSDLGLPSRRHLSP